MEFDFKKKYEEVTSGKIYEKYGLKENPFIPSPNYIEASFLNREVERDKFVRVLADMIKGRSPHIPILGNHGIGKTHFLKYMYKKVRENMSMLGVDDVSYIGGEKEFKKIIDKESIYSHISQDTLVFVDDLDIITVNDSKGANRLFYKFPSRVVGTWNFRAWNSAKRRTDIKVPKADPIVLHGMVDKVMEEIMYRRLELSCSKFDRVKTFFPREIVDAIVFKSQGNPYALVSTARMYLDYLISNDVKTVTSDVVQVFTKKINLVSVQEAIKNIDELTPKQREVLKNILDMEEVNAKSLAEKLGFHRVAAVQHLKVLEAKDLVESKTKDRIVNYYVPSEIADEVHEKLDLDPED